MNVFELFATLGLDSTAYDEGLSSAEEKGSSFGQKLGGVVATGAKVGMAAIAATTTAVVGTSAAFAKGIASTAAYGDSIQKNAQKMGMSFEKYQEWDAIMRHNGTSMETLKTGMKTLANAAETGNKAFEKLGITQEDIANMDQEQLFAATIAGLQNVESTTERTYLAGQLLGRGATELGALLNTSAEDTEKMRARVHELGGVMSDEAVNASAKFQDSMQDLKTSFTGLKNNMMAEFLPSITTAMNGLQEIMIGNDSKGLAMIDEGVNNFIDNLTKAAPKILQVGGRIIGSLMTAISNNLPELIKQGAPIMEQLATGIISALPALLDSGLMIIEQVGGALLDNADLLINTALTLVQKLAGFLTKNAPVIIPAIVNLITTIIRTLTEPNTLTSLIKAAIQLTVAIAKGLLEAAPQLIAVIPELIGNLIMALNNTWPDLLSAVLELLGALGLSILESLAALMGTSLDEVAEGWGYLFQDLSQWGKDILNWITGIGKSISTGINKIWTGITSFFTNGFNSIKDKASSGLDAVRQTFVNIFDKVKSVVKGAIDFIKGIFKFSWKLPEIKLPHFKVSGGEAPWGFGGKGSLPSVKVQWYKKAYDAPYFLDDATIFGFANGSYLGGGEGKGSEMIVGTEKLMSMMRQAMGVENRPINIYIQGAEGQDVRQLAKEVSKELQLLKSDKEAAYGLT